MTDDDIGIRSIEFSIVPLSDPSQLLHPAFVKRLLLLKLNPGTNS
jgi:hypothetical protein